MTFSGVSRKQTPTSVVLLTGRTPRDIVVPAGTICSAAGSAFIGSAADLALMGSVTGLILVGSDTGSTLGCLKVKGAFLDVLEDGGLEADLATFVSSSIVAIFVSIIRSSLTLASTPSTIMFPISSSSSIPLSFTSLNLSQKLNPQLVLKIRIGNLPHKLPHLLQPHLPLASTGPARHTCYITAGVLVKEAGSGRSWLGATFTNAPPIKVKDGELALSLLHCVNVFCKKIIILSTAFLA